MSLELLEDSFPDQAIGSLKLVVGHAEIDLFELGFPLQIQATFPS